MFGVSYAHLNALRKNIKQDHAAALALWRSGNHDARVLATMIADPAQADEALLDAWADDLGDYVLTDAFAGYVSHTTYTHEKMGSWMNAGHEWKGQAAWILLGKMALYDKTLPDAFFLPYLDLIAGEIHERLNRERHSMNMALIAIGMRSEELEQHALAVAARIGVVEVDHLQTSCKTPDAAAYIRRAKQRRQGRAR